MTFIPGQRFREWSKGYRVRELHPNAVTPNRRGLAAIEHHELVAEARLFGEGVKPELSRYVAAIGAWT